MKPLNSLALRPLPFGVAILLAAAACGRPEEPPRAFPKDVAGDGAAASDTAAGWEEIPAAPDPSVPTDTPPAAADGATSLPPAPADRPTVPAPVSPLPPAPRPDSGWSVGTSSGAAAGGMATQRNARVARQDGYDRIVLDLGPGDVPGWHIEYVDAPVRQCGSGDEVRLGGEAWLSIRLEPAQAHDDAGIATVHERRFVPGLPNLVELRLICDFEGQVEWVAGLRSPEPYRVLRLREPGRVVVDIRHPRD